MATTDFCDGDYLGAYRRFLEHFVANVCRHDDQLPVKMSRRDVRECEVAGEIADISLQHLNQRICPPSLQAYLVKLVTDEFKILFQMQPEECGYRPLDKTFSPLKLMQAVTNKVNEICQRYLDNSRLALLPPPPSTPLPLASSYAIKNRRRKMEDRSVVLHDLHTMFSIKNDAVVNYYAVFDGHGGQEAATYCAAHLHQYLIESPYYPADPELALRDAFQTTDVRFIECDDTKNSGATAVCALLYDKTLYIAWAGDSQAALIKNGRGINLTIPHKPERPDEKLRIESLGGEVIYYGTWRVNGILNVSRSLGDAKYKPYVSDEPEIKRIDLDGTEDFLIVACDGFWERATEDIVASLLYEYVGSSHCDYNSASEALVNWAKQNFSEDNISVIVVFLTPPAEIAAKSFFDPRPVQCAPSMEPGYQHQHQEQQPPYELDFGFGGKQPQQPPLLQPQQQANGNDDGGFTATAVLEPINGRHRPKPPRYNDDDDDDEEEEDEEEDVDLGPETNVDAVDEAPGEFGKLDQAMGQNYPDEFLLKMPAKREDEDFPVEIKKRHQNELIPEADNVADSEDSEDEWNYYRPDDNKNSSGGGVDDDGCPAPTAAQDAITEQQLPQIKDPALVEKPDQCEEEKEPCSPKPYEDNNSLDNQPVSSTAEAELEADADEVTAEYDELHEIEETKEHREAEFELKDTDTEAEAATIPEEDFPFDKDQQQQLKQRLQEQQQLEEHLQEQQQLEEHIQEQQQLEEHLQHQLEQQFQQQEQESEQEQELLNEKDDEDEDMESHLNPDAAEFVPTTGTPPMIPQLMTQINSDLVAGSPLKQSQRALKNRTIPSEEEFQEEVCRRPSELDDASDYSNGEPSPQKDLLGGGFSDDMQKTMINVLNLDESEISSTKAEFGDESAANYSVASEFYKTGLSPIDCSFTGSDRGDFDFSKDAMATSMTPGDFKNAFEQEPDLNKVHDLSDDDLMGDVQNGTIEETDEKMIVDNITEDIGKDKIELDFDNFAPQQQQNAEVFSTIVEQRESDNKDLFMNMRNAEHGFEFEQVKEERNLIDTTEPLEVTSTENEKVGGFSSNDMPTYASNNPFAADYVPMPESEQEQSIQSLTDDMQHINLEEPKQQLFDNSFEHFAEEPEVQKDSYEQVMQNPLDLNFGMTAEQKSDEPVLVSPVKEPEVMTSKFEEEDLMSKSAEALQLQQEPYQNLEQDEFFLKTNHVEDLCPAQPEEKLIQALPVDKVPDSVEDIHENVEEIHKNVEEIHKNVEEMHENVDKLHENVDKIHENVDKIHENIDKIHENAEETHEEIRENIEKIHENIEEIHENIEEIHENIKEIHENVQESATENVENFERKSINLSESLQEFTGLEEQLSPKQDEVKDNIHAEEPQILKENLVDEQKDIEEVKAPSQIVDTKIEEVPEVTNEPSVLSNEIPENVAASKVAVTAAAAAAATAAAAAAAVTAATAVAAKSTKTTPAAPKTSKSAVTSKVGAKSTTPTSPTKTGVAAKPGATTATKKPTTTTASRLKSTTGTVTKTATSTLSKTAAAKPTTAPKTATSAATKTSPRATSTAAAAKAKPLPSQRAVSFKVGSTTSEKKPTANGEVKPTLSSKSATPKATPKPPATSTTSKTGLVKTSTTTRTSTGATTAAALKARPTSAATTKTPASKVSSSNVTSSTNSTAARPKTAPTSTLNAAAKPKVGAAAKSPMIDKQIKETANKQISSARTSTTTPKTRLSSSTPSSTTTTAKRMSLVQKQTATGVTGSPTKKPAPITKPGSKTSITSKTNSKVMSTTKTTTTTATATAKVVQNGVCEAQETTINTTTTTTTNIEEDIPKKDVSPIEPLTDNQLITAE